MSLFILTARLIYLSIVVARNLKYFLTKLTRKQQENKERTPEGR